MNFTIVNNLLFLDGKQVEFIDSPNKSLGNITPQYLIEHYTASTSLEGTKSWFKSKDSKVSAHLVIGRNGEIVQFVKFNQRGWHAGESEYNGLKGLNSFSIGIELVNAGRLIKKGDKYYGDKEVPVSEVVKLKHKNETAEAYWQTYTDKQIEVTLAVSKLLVEHYLLKEILGHEDIAPKRKSDPGPAFPMNKFKELQADSSWAITKSNVNIRTGEGVEFKAIDVIPDKSTIQLITKGLVWSRVNYLGKLGYVNNTYLIFTK
jgi:N-acetylmuramoyl-L-alanine amidase